MILVPVTAQNSQKEKSWWFFGYNTGLNFNVKNPVVADDGTTLAMPETLVGPVYTLEGCLAMSDKNGNLLFSSDGVTVYNKDNYVMVNGTGLLGHPSATQSGIVCPIPDSRSKYYLITVGEDASTDIRYSIVDMSLQNGKGEITLKNQLIATGANENIALVPKASMDGYWLVYRVRDNLRVHDVTATGISTTIHQGVWTPSIKVTTICFVGETFFSPDYKKMIALNFDAKQIISADFDNDTGFLSNVRVLNLGAGTYGGCFSPNSEYVYITSGYMDGARLFVVKWDDLRAGVAPTVLTKATPTSNISLGPDNRLYGIQYYGGVPSGKKILTITNPYQGGTDIHSFSNYLANDGGYLGLPTFSAGYLSALVEASPFACCSHPTKITADISNSMTSPTAVVNKLEWDFGDGSPIDDQAFVANQSVYKNVHTYTSPGEYTVEVTPVFMSGVKGKTVSATVSVTYCTLKSNKMTRSSLPNSKQVGQ